VKVLVVDDEPLARERMLRLLAKIVPDASLLEAGNGLQALELVAMEQPDLLLLDIRMPGMDGLEVATGLQDLEQPPAIIFCTAYDNYALEALERQAAAYLVKPVREEKLRQAIVRAAQLNRLQLASQGEASEARRSHFVGESHRGVEMQPITDIRCFIAEQKYVRAVHPAGSLLIPDTLKELEREFAGMFLRVHRNALVARAHITGLTRDGEGGWLVTLADFDEHPGVSRRHLGELKDQLRS